jgi:hypothetical protein
VSARILAGFASCVACAAYVACLACAARATTLPGGVVSAGGSPATSGARRLNGSVAQLAAGSSSAASRVLWHGFWSAGVSQVVAVDPADPLAALPAELELGLPAPNPSRGRVQFALALPTRALVQLAIFDVTGREVSRQPEQMMSAGRWTIAWEAAAGSQPQAGVYFARLSVDGRMRATRRVVRVR